MTQTPKIPRWINILQVLILAILLFQAFACYFNPSLIYPGIVIDSTSASKAMYVLAGRNTVMVVISVLALFWQKPHFFSFAFGMHSLRELQDMIITPMHIADTTVAIGLFFFVPVCLRDPGDHRYDHTLAAFKA